MDIFPTTKNSLPPIETEVKNNEERENTFSLEWFGYFILGLTFFLLPIFIWPSRFFFLDVSKVILVSSGVILTLVIFLLNAVKSGRLEFPQHKIFLGALLVPLVFLVSGIFGLNPKASLFGYGLETGTWAFVVLGFLLFFLTAIFFKTRERVFYSFIAFLGGLTIVALVALIKLLSGGSFLSFLALEGVVGNSVGSWMDLAVFLGVGVVMTVTAIELGPLSSKNKGILFGIFILSLFVLAVLNFTIVWLLLLIFSLVLFIYFASIRTTDDSGRAKRKVSYASLILILVSLVFFLNPNLSSSGRLGNVLSESFGVVTSDVKPSLVATFNIMQSSFSERALLGSGPNNFDLEWTSFKPEGVNLSNFWNVYFTSGFSLLMTFVVTTGVLGLLAWLTFFFFYLRLGLKSLFSRSEDPLGKFLLMSTFVASLFLWAMCALYIPNTTIFALTFFFTGLFVASSVAEGVTSLKRIEFGHSAKLSFLFNIILIALLVGGVGFSYNTIVRATSLNYFQRALVAANETGDVEVAIDHLNRAANMMGYDVYYRSLAQAYITRVNQVLDDESLTDDERAGLFQDYLRNAITSGQLAIEANRSYYLNWLSLGRIYESLISPPFSLEGAYESTKGAYLEALARNPNSPEVYLLLARVEVLNGNLLGARDYISQSLSKKNNYADAYFLLTQIELAEDNLERAIEAAELGAVLSPSNAGVFFQLGLLKYNAPDYQGAAEAFAWAINLVPDYANAKYFLGLSLEKLGFQDDAINQFEDLLVTNPDNEEVAIILENLRGGRDPFFQLPPNLTDLESRASLPITEREER